MPLIWKDILLYEGMAALSCMGHAASRIVFQPPTDWHKRGHCKLPTNKRNNMISFQDGCGI